MALTIINQPARPLDPELHYTANVGPIEHEEPSECEIAIENIGWTLGNDCPYRCSHCYSMSARRKDANLEPWMVDRIAGQLADLGVKTVNLGANEPIFTNGIDVRATLLPYIIETLADRGIVVGLTTSGITLLKLERHFSHVIPGQPRHQLQLGEASLSDRFDHLRRAGGHPTWPSDPSMSAPR
jgi:radical SAM family protein